MKQSWSWNMNNDCEIVHLYKKKNLHNSLICDERSFIEFRSLGNASSGKIQDGSALWTSKLSLNSYRFLSSNISLPFDEYPCMECMLLLQKKSSFWKNNFAIWCCHLRIIVFEILWQGKEFFWLLKATFDSLFRNSMVFQVSKSPSGQSLS